jgi:hypothetical protein
MNCNVIDVRGATVNTKQGWSGTAETKQSREQRQETVGDKTKTRERDEDDDVDDDIA